MTRTCAAPTRWHVSRLSTRLMEYSAATAAAASPTSTAARSRGYMAVARFSRVLELASECRMENVEDDVMGDGGIVVLSARWCRGGLT